jgi:hypothetical protein
MTVLIGIGSVKGSPGATTLGLGLAAVWPATASVLVELDPSGGDIAVRYQTGQDPGLVSLAAAARRTAVTTEIDLLDHAHDLGNGLYAVPAPVGSEQARVGVDLVAANAAVLRAPVENGAVDVVVLDLGRLDPSSPVMPLLCELDVLLVAARGDVTDLAHLAARGPTLADLGPAPTHIGILLTQGCVYRIRDVEEAVGLPIFAAVPHDDLAATALSGGPASPRLGRGGHRLGSRPLMRTLRDLAEQLAAVDPPHVSRAPIAALEGAPSTVLTSSPKPSAATTRSVPTGASRLDGSAAQAGRAQPTQSSPEKQPAMENPWVPR